MAELLWHGKAQLPPVLANEGAFRLRERYASDLSGIDGWHNRLILGERAAVLAGLLAEFAGCVDLIYIDPPFMTERNFMSGSRLAYSDKWQGGLDSYLQWLALTLRLLYNLLAQDGCLYIHLDWRVIHYARLILDEIFGANLQGRGPGFQNEIIWHYQSGGRATRRFARKHDTILFYAKSANYRFHAERIGEKRGKHKRNHMRREQTEEGQVFWTITSHGRTYRYSEESLMTPSDVWSDISHLHQRDPQRNGYATQKPEALLERILLASSDPGDLVLDCFCGSGVTPVVAEKLGRRWLASDQGELALNTTLERLQTLPAGPFMIQEIGSSL